MPARLRNTRIVVGSTIALLLVAATTVSSSMTPGSSSPPDTITAEAAALAVDPGGVDPAGPAAPAIVPRTEWDPNGLCPVSDGSASAPERIHLHHTHIPVVERPEEVAGAMQSICRAHRERGFSEVGYHYAVDPFGRVWQARGPLPGDADGDVREGAHAQGFNEGSVGVVLIGDFDVAPPTAEALEATTDLLAWLSGRYDLDPTTTLGAVSTGGPATRFPEGTEVELHTIAGHRDTGSGTSCPGEHLYRLLPDIRASVAERLAEA